MKLKKIIAITVPIICGMLLLGCGQESINLNEYVTIDVSGYDGLGKVNDSFDYQRMGIDHDDSLKYKGSEKSIERKIEKEGISKYLYENYINYTIRTTSDELSNNDAVTLHWECNSEKVEKMFNCKLEYADITVRVENLQELEKKDFFENIEVRVDGLSPAGEIVSLVPAFKDIEYIADPQTGLANGDVINISLKQEDKMYYIERYNAIPDSMSMKYTVNGLDSYLTEINQLDDSTIEMLMKDYEVILKDKESDSLVSNATHEIEKMILLTSKDPKGYEQNVLYLIAHQNFDYRKPLTKTTINIDRYLYKAYRNIIVYKDGSVFVDMKNTEEPIFMFGTGIGFVCEGQNVTGYENYDNLYNDIVTNNVSNWNSETINMSDISTSEVIGNDEIIDAYIEYYNTHPKEKTVADDYENVAFTFINIDEDNVPEMVVGYYYGDDVSPQMELQNYFNNFECPLYEVEIYTYDKGSVILLDEISTVDYGLMYAPKKNKLYKFGGSGTECQSMIFEMSNNQFSLICGNAEEGNLDNDNWDYYKLTTMDIFNGKVSITKEEHKKMDEDMQKEAKNMRYIEDEKYYNSIELAAENIQ